MPDREDDRMSFPLPPSTPEPVKIDQCANCRGLCPPGDVDENGVCSDCREISARTAALNAPRPPKPAPESEEPFGEAKVVNGPLQWWNRD